MGQSAAFGPINFQKKPRPLVWEWGTVLAQSYARSSIRGSGTGGRPSVAVVRSVRIVLAGTALALCACGAKDVPAPSRGQLSAAPVAAMPPTDAPVVSVPLADVAHAGVPAGRRVRVTGRCLASRSAPPDVSMSDFEPWRLDDGRASIVVVGGRPSACSVSGAVVSIVAVVAEDTLPPIGDLPASPRRHLVFVEVLPE